MRKLLGLTALLAGLLLAGAITNPGAFKSLWIAGGAFTVDDDGNVSSDGTGTFDGGVTGLAIGSDVQAHDGDLDDLAGETPTADYVLQGDGADWQAVDMADLEVDAAYYAVEAGNATLLESSTWSSPPAAGVGAQTRVPLYGSTVRATDDLTMTEMITNGDNEAAVATIAGATTSTTRATWTQSATEAHGGTNSAALAANGAAGTSFEYRLSSNEKTRWVFGMKYRASAWIFIPTAASITNVKMEFNANGTAYNSSYVTTEDSWQYVSKEWTMPYTYSSATVYFRFYVSGDSSNLSNIVYIDDISLTAYSGGTGFDGGPHSIYGDLLVENSLFEEAITVTADATTVDLSGGNVFVIPATWTAGHNITALTSTALAKAQRVLFLGGDSDCVIESTGTIYLNSVLGNWTAAARASLSLFTVDGTSWYEIGRSANR